MYSRTKPAVTRAVALRHPFFSSGIVSLLLGLMTLSAPAGSIVRLIYDGIPGNAVSNLTAAPAFPDSPTRTETLTMLLEGVPDDGDNYGSFISGYVEAPLTGSYIFWISSDDASELWLSTDHTAANKKRIARVDAVTGYRAWDITPLQRSANIFLQRGRKYYLEVYHKEGGGGDSISVGWLLPGGTFDRPISGIYLAPFPAGSNDPPVITQQPVDAMKMEVETATFFVNVTGTQPINYQWFRNGAAIPGAILSSYTTGPLVLADDGAIFRVGITNAFGDAMSADATLHVTPDTAAPTIQSVAVLPDAQCNLTQFRVVYSEPVDPGSATNPDRYQLNGATLSGAIVVLVPGHPEQVLVTPTLPLECDHAYTLVVNGVQDMHGNGGMSVISMAFDSLGLACCHPSYSVDLLPGLNSIANHLDKGGNTVAEVLSAVPDGTSLYQWNPAAQSFTMNSFDILGGWTDPSMTLAPGEGALIQPGPFAGATFRITFGGTRRVPVLPVSLGAGFQLLSRQTPQAAKFADLTGAPPSNGSVVYQLRPGAAATDLLIDNYTIHTFRGGLWDGGEPVAALGEAVFIRQGAPVVITTQPAVQLSAPPGSTVVLTVAATGEPPLTFQWRLNGVNIPGATSQDFVVPNAQATNSGSYSVGVANSVSAVSSSNALVRVIAPPLQLNDQFESAILVTA
ncbi:MAG TPA: immunoglobulin domain-containing protein, partial [Verrucomicrobiae bacterium]